MREETKSLPELTDSRMMFEKKFPPFGFFLILVFGVFCGLVVIWSIKTPKIYYVQAHGIITNQEANYVMCTYTGEIGECHLEEGAVVEEGDVLFTVRSTDYDLQEQQLIKNKEAYEAKVEKYRLLVQSIKDDINYFEATDSGSELYYSMYETYKSKVTQSALDVSTYKAYGYTDEQIESELVKNQGKISEIYYTAIQSAENAISELTLQIDGIDAQLMTIKSGQACYEVKATASGVLHLLADYKNGMVVQTTSTVAQITPENSERVIEAYVTTADMARIHEGDETQIVVDGLVQNVYGALKGKVIHIDSNVTMRDSENGSAQLFRVLIDMDNDYLIGRMGDKVDLTNGMTAVARVQYNKITYFNYVLDKLGFK